MKKATFSGLLVVLVLSVLSGCAKATTGTGSAEGFKGPVEVSVTVKDGKVTGATLTTMDDTQEIGGVAVVVLESGNNIITACRHSQSFCIGDLYRIGIIAVALHTGTVGTEERKCLRHD